MTFGRCCAAVASAALLLSVSDAFQPGPANIRPTSVASIDRQGSSLGATGSSDGGASIQSRNDGGDDERLAPSSLPARRDYLHRCAVAVFAVAVGTAGSSTGGNRRANALDLPQMLLAANGASDRAVKGSPASSKKIGGLSGKIRSVEKVMDELQRDLMEERWDLIPAYNGQLRSYVPVFTAYTDSAFPTDSSSDQGFRVELRYEVGRIFGSLQRLKSAAGRQSLDEAYVAYSDMALHFDRYLRVGGMYGVEKKVVNLELYFKGVPDKSLIWSDPKKDPALVRDLVVLREGPNKGRTGIVIGIYPDGSDTCALKMDRSRGVREVLVVPRLWAAKRLGEQDPDEVFLIPRT